MGKAGMRIVWPTLRNNRSWFHGSNDRPSLWANLALLLSDGLLQTREGWRDRRRTDVLGCRCSWSHRLYKWLNLAVCDYTQTQNLALRLPSCGVLTDDWLNLRATCGLHQADWSGISNRGAGAAAVIRSSPGDCNQHPGWRATWGDNVYFLSSPMWSAFWTQWFTNADKTSLPCLHYRGKRLTNRCALRMNKLQISLKEQNIKINHVGLGPIYPSFEIF